MNKEDKDLLMIEEDNNNNSRKIYVRKYRHIKKDDKYDPECFEGEIYFNN